MKTFIKVTKTYNDKLLYFTSGELNLKKGSKVRILGGPLKGLKGIFLRVKGARNRGVVIAIEGLLAVALTTIDPDMTENISDL